jgi:cytochrome c
MRFQLVNIARIAIAILLGAMALNTLAAPPEARADLRGSDVERRAAALLDRAVAHVEAKGEAGTADFNHGPAFIDRDLYVYALRTDGTFLASGGDSAALVGQNVLNETDLNGRPFFREIIDQARGFGSGRVEYRWFNPADSRGRPKVALFRRVGEVIVAAGYYPPRATATEARALLRDAIAAMDANRDAALKRFQQLDGPFIHNDLYVFVVRVSDGRFLAHGATPALVGTNGYELKGPDGTAVIRKMVDIARTHPRGAMEYAWRNPSTGVVEQKHTFFKIEGDVLIGVGYYLR